MRELKKVRNEIRRKESQLATLEEELKILKEHEEQLEDMEMISAIRKARLNADDMLAMVKAIKSGETDLSALFPQGQESDEPSPDDEDATIKESEDTTHETDEM